MSFDQNFLPREVNAHLHPLLAPPYPVLLRIEREAEAERQPAIGRQTGSLLRSLAQAMRATRVLEVGTNLGYSALWLAAGLAPGGVLEGIEIDPRLAARARANLREADPVRSATIHEGAALDVLPRLPDAAYDLIFLDAVKAEYPQYLDQALRLLRPGGIVAADNLLWSGRVWDEASQDPDTRGVREYTRRIFAEPRLSSTLVPVEDGLGISILR